MDLLHTLSHKYKIMRLLCFFALWLTSFSISAQYLKIDNGIILSSFSNEDDLAILDTRVVNYIGSIGLDYLEKEWFSLSSQIGYVRIGGEQEVDNVTPEIGEIIEQKSYIHFNTTFRPRLEMEDVSFFVGIGPTLDILMGSNDAESPFFTGYRYNNTRIGGKAEIGILHTKNKFRLGVIGGYLRDFSPTTETEFISLFNHAFTATITAGYRIK